MTGVLLLRQTPAGAGLKEGRGAASYCRSAPSARSYSWHHPASRMLGGQFDWNRSESSFSRTSALAMSFPPWRGGKSPLALLIAPAVGNYGKLHVCHRFILPTLIEIYVVRRWQLIFAKIPDHYP